MDAQTKLLERISTEQDDVLATLQLVRGDVTLEHRLYDQLVDLLVEAMFLGLRKEMLDGNLTRGEYTAELAGLADSCRRLGLLPQSVHER